MTAAFKAKTKKSVGNVPTQFESVSDYLPRNIRIQGIVYTNPNLDQHVHILDAEGDDCFLQTPGQSTPHVLTLDVPVTVQGPLSYVDEDPNGGHTIIVFGESF